ncbi:hypothetical protein ABIA39_001668 [Nocardia sp. GAS34]|uniref:MFS transporter n=1 Tax=unclassified Nocardia TaxID=2637762 RepID=UPI003D1B8285
MRSRTPSHYAHARGVLHRDVKPANILLAAAEAGRAERAVLTDFGIARLLASNTQLTSSGTFVATLAFASPEQLSGDPVDARSDQYSLACSLYALLVGQSPFAAAEPGQVVAGHLAKPVPPIARPDVPPQLNAVIARGMAKNPGERFSSAGEFAAVAMGALQTAVPAAAPTVHYAGAARAPGFAPPPMPGPQPFGVYPPPVPVAAGPRNPWVALCALLIGAFFVGLTSDGLGPAYAEIMKNIYITGLALLMLGAVGCFLAANMAMLTAFFAIQGLGMGLMLPQPLAVIIRTFPPERRGAALGAWAGGRGPRGPARPGRGRRAGRPDELADDLRDRHCGPRSTATPQRPTDTPASTRNDGCGRCGELLPPPAPATRLRGATAACPVMGGIVSR